MQEMDASTQNTHKHAKHMNTWALKHPKYMSTWALNNAITQAHKACQARKHAKHAKQEKTHAGGQESI